MLYDIAQVFIEQTTISERIHSVSILTFHFRDVTAFTYYYETAKTLFRVFCQIGFSARRQIIFELIGTFTPINLILIAFASFLDFGFSVRLITAIIISRFGFLLRTYEILYQKVSLKEIILIFK